MHKLHFLLFISSFLLIISCDFLGETDNSLVVVHTEYGDLTFKLYEQPEEHTENFHDLIEDGFYDSTTFHRILDGEMVQGGDPNTKDDDRFNDGMGGPGYKLPAEIFPELIHQKGALVSARVIGKDKLDKTAHGSQFFIVYGKTWTDQSIDSLANRRTSDIENFYIAKYLGDSLNSKIRDRMVKLSNEKKTDEFNQVTDSIRKVIINKFDLKPITYSEEARNIYKTAGGMPQWDGEYTVFGQLVDGFDAFEKIMKAKKGPNGRPEKDIIVTMEITGSEGAINNNESNTSNE
ncbi:peptidylprolyl isomerase [Marinigracilibium pacificum]|uniref:peptidylprolyl isomerase n=1 Tax=Marinigracilibium pacificum TaxID=2729599 RepID=A0A848J0P4_9BACT|nr:peptidylprolyl isomerase [Marinigracilibium pacificum]NMM50363.1 peptidylprolyl isomerase [Marinigracilibium pacificum]